MPSVRVAVLFLDEVYLERGMFVAGVLEMLHSQWNFFVVSLSDFRD